MSNGSRFKEVEAIFHRAVCLRGESLQCFLNEACGADSKLRAEVDSLLRADSQEDAAFDRPLVNSLNSKDLGSLLYTDGQQPRRNSPAFGENPTTRRKDTMPQQTQCNRGHFFDPTEHVTCPYCGVVGLSADMGATRPMETRPAGQPQGGAAKPVHSDEGTRRKVNADDAPTMKYDPSGTGAAKQIDPVVGWLVCVDGPDRGRDYRIHAQRNFIGRDQGMDICIASDPNVSRINHATPIFDPRSNAFRIAPGDAHGMTYLNNESVDIPMALKPYDAIELGPLGSTKLLFIPFCGEAFQWR